MFASRPELRARMVELRARTVVLPAAGVVAGVAGAAKVGLPERAVVRILVTAIAAGKLQSLELRVLLARFRTVALRAGLLLVQTGELEPRGGMVEAGSRPEAVLRVTAEAVRAELALMLVLMAGRTLAAETQEGTARVLQFDLGARGGRDLRRDVAVRALLLPVLAFQLEAGLREVVEVLTLETDERRRPALMFLMAAAAVGFSVRALIIAPVKAGLRIHSPPDFDVTREALEPARRVPEFVARSAFREPLQLLVGGREGARRDLRPRAAAHPKRQRGGERASGMSPRDPRFHRSPRAESPNTRTFP